MKKESISAEDRNQITEQMIIVADRISVKDTENKEFLRGIIKNGLNLIAGALELGAAILGVILKNVKIPTLK